ncbi:flippase-like domain-containing protein [Myxococcota bacterium]|nr:flippase-like domain-containing protein [Myxococcota bacterium]
MRDVDFRAVGGLILEADWLILIGLSVPSYVWANDLRARRWRHFTRPIASIGYGPHFRAISVGLMVNNVLPLRIGEIVRAWYLGRESDTRVASLLGTVALERIIDVLTILSLAAVVLMVWGARGEGALAQGALLLAPVAMGPAVGLAWLRIAPGQVHRALAWVLRPFPPRISQAARNLLEQFEAGLGSLHAGSHLFWIGVDSVLIWAVASTLPFLAGFAALGIELGSWSETLVAAWAVLVAVALAVALPAAPGFFGIYHAAAKWALIRFGVTAKTAVAFGTLVHSVMWVTVILIGVLVLRRRGTSLRALRQMTDVGEPPRSE